MSGPQERSTLLRSLGPLMNLGVTFAVAIGGLAFLGHWLDLRWGSEPWMTLAGAVLGMVVGFVNLFRTVARSSSGPRPGAG